MARRSTRLRGTDATPTRRRIFWLLGAALFYVVALGPNLQFAAFATYTHANLVFLGGCAVVFFLFWLFDKLIATDARPSRPQRGS